jgi:ferritin-like protein
MQNFHEPVEEISKETRNYIRALNSLKEEIEAIDWYQQRLDAATDDELKNILAHNRNEEMEHACMALEWLRRNMPGWDKKMKTYLFTEGALTEIEEGEEETSRKLESLNIGKS